MCILTVHVFVWPECSFRINPAILTEYCICSLETQNVFIIGNDLWIALFCVLQMFKGPAEDIQYIYTASSSAVCGVTLETGGKKEYLIAG